MEVVMLRAGIGRFVNWLLGLFGYEMVLIEEAERVRQLKHLESEIKLHGGLNGIKDFLHFVKGGQLKYVVFSIEDKTSWPIDISRFVAGTLPTSFYPDDWRNRIEKLLAIGLVIAPQILVDRLSKVDPLSTLGIETPGTVAPRDHVEREPGGDDAPTYLIEE